MTIEKKMEESIQDIGKRRYDTSFNNLRDVYRTLIESDKLNKSQIFEVGSAIMYIGVLLLGGRLADATNEISSLKQYLKKEKII